ncbi:MAG: hypothetical protein QOE22_188 [Candidatus Parcubacteria bacterium]|jgi:hypothetical protein|nr:hypothetical protein [Candidatus Parcubacteria bacterium]
MKFLVIYKTPVSVLDKWMETPPEARKEMEEKMGAEWNAWLKQHADHVKETAGAGKTKLVTKDGIADARNDIMMYSIVEADSQEAAAKMYEGHSHLQIPEATIEIMQANVLPGMQ